MGAPDLLIVAGEASGDLHGGRMLAELRTLRPELRPFGLGGRELADAGLDSLAASSEISVVGITEVLRILPRAREIFRMLLREADRRQVETAILIDFPDFNLRLARRLHQRGIRVVYYISPQIWAWRRRRIRSIARDVDKMLVVLPFEEEFYRQHGVEALHVGHPLVDEVPELPQIWDQELAVDAPYEIALLPGSRRSEIESLLPRMLGAAKKLGDSQPINLSLIKAPPISKQFLLEVMGPSDLEVRFVEESRFEAIAGCHLALCAVGTAALEVGLLGTPMIVVHRLQPVSAMLGRMMLRLPAVSLVNLVLGRKVVPELLQEDATAEIIAAECNRLVGSPDRIRRMRADLLQLRGALGERGASRRAAQAISGMLGPMAVAPSSTAGVGV